MSPRRDDERIAQLYRQAAGAAAVAAAAARVLVLVEGLAPSERLALLETISARAIELQQAAAAVTPPAAHT